MKWPRVFVGLEEVEWRWKDLDAFARWAAEESGYDDVVVILDREGDDENALVLEIWVGDCPPGREEIARKEHERRRE